MHPLAFRNLTLVAQGVKEALAVRMVQDVNPSYLPPRVKDAIRVSLIGLHFEGLLGFNEQANGLQTPAEARAAMAAAALNEEDRRAINAQLDAHYDTEFEVIAGTDMPGKARNFYMF